MRGVTITVRPMRAAGTRAVLGVRARDRRGGRAGRGGRPPGRSSRRPCPGGRRPCPGGRRPCPGGRRPCPSAAVCGPFAAWLQRPSIRRNSARRPMVSLGVTRPRVTPAQWKHQGFAAARCPSERPTRRFSMWQSPLHAPLNPTRRRPAAQSWRRGESLDALRRSGNPHFPLIFTRRTHLSLAALRAAAQPTKITRGGLTRTRAAAAHARGPMTRREAARSAALSRSRGRRARG